MLQCPEPELEEQEFTAPWSTHPQGEQNETNYLVMASNDYQKAYDIYPQSWIIDCLKMIFGEIIIENRNRKDHGNLKSGRGNIRK